MFKCFCMKLSKKWSLLHINRLKLTIFLAKIAHFVLSAQNASICIRMHQNVCRMNCANVLCTKLSKKWILLHLNGLKCINMHPVASKCKHNEMCKCFCTKLSKMWFLFHINRLKLTIFLAKIAHFVLSAQNASICNKMYA